MSSTRKALSTVVVVSTLLYGVASLAAEKEGSVKEGAKDVGRAVGSAFREIGHGAKKAGKAVGHAAKEGVEAAKEGGREFKKAIKREK